MPSPVGRWCTGDQVHGIASEICEKIAELRRSASLKTTEAVLALARLTEVG